MPPKLCKTKGSNEKENDAKFFSNVSLFHYQISRLIFLGQINQINKKSNRKNSFLGAENLDISYFQYLN